MQSQVDRGNHSVMPPEESWEKLRMHEPERISFHLVREAAILVARELQSEIAICRALPGAPQSFQNLLIAEATATGREILAIVSGKSVCRPFFDRDLSLTSSDMEIVHSVMRRIETAKTEFLMMAMTDLASIIKYISFSDIQKSPYAEVIKFAAEAILSGKDAGVACHASGVFPMCPDATRLFADQFTKFLEEKTHPTYNYITARALSIALENCQPR